MTKYSLASTTWDEQEIEAINEVVKSGMYSMGERVIAFEEAFARKVGSKFSVMVNSGSSANLILVSGCRYMKKSKLMPGDEVIVPAVSWSTTYYPITQIGAVLKFVDINPDTLNIDVTKIEEAITPKTKAIFVVNLLGNPADWVSIEKIANQHGLLLIEDNCESLGATLGGKLLGTFGFGGTFSSFFSHHISTMEGGLIATDDEELYQVMKSLRAHGWTRELPEKNHVFDKTGHAWDDLYRFVLPGYNVRPLEMEAAIGLVQLGKLDSFISARRKNAELFQCAIQDLDGYRIQKENGNSSWFGFSLILEGKLKGKRAGLIPLLTRAAIDSRPIVTGNFARNPVIEHLPHSDLGPLPVSDDIHENGLFVGNHHYDLNNELDLLIEILTDFERSI
jgi:CDP-4-dehydro-6-deoxyglucose reductase, E1